MSADDYLAAQRARAAPADAELWAELDTYYKKKLWHQLTVFLETHFNHSIFQADGLPSLYEKFIAKFEDRINQLSLVKLLLQVAKQLPTPAAAIAFLSTFREKVKKTDQANLLLLSSIADLQLDAQDSAAAKELIDACTPLVDSITGVSPVHYAYYRMCARYYKIKGDYVAYYADALRFLGCVDLTTLPVAEQQEWAYDLGIAGLLGDTIYNFGELLSNPVLASLTGTPRAWMLDLLGAFNSGSAAAVTALKPQWATNQNLASSETFLREKLKLLSLMEQVYRAPAHERALSFASIAQTAGVAVQEVEVLVIRALSRGLVKGSLDGVAKIAHLPWVQPRVLDKNQLAAMHDNIQKWIATVRQAAADVRTHGPELLAE